MIEEPIARARTGFRRFAILALMPIGGLAAVVVVALLLNGGDEVVRFIDTRILGNRLPAAEGAALPSATGPVADRKPAGTDHLTPEFRDVLRELEEGPDAALRQANEAATGAVAVTPPAPRRPVAADRRRPITRIEIVRIRPQSRPGEDIAGLIDDPWRVIECDGDPVGCAGTFTDPEFADAGRDTLYYARAFEAEKPGINAGNVRCERDGAGRCTSVDLCPGPEGVQDDCLAPHEPRAWSSPIYVDFGG